MVDHIGWKDKRLIPRKKLNEDPPTKSNQNLLTSVVSNVLTRLTSRVVGKNVNLAKNVDHPVE